MFSRVSQWSISWVRWTQFTFWRTFPPRFILILSFLLLRPALPRGFFSCFPIKILYSFSTLQRVLYASWFHRPNNALWIVQVMKLLMSFPFPSSIPHLTKIHDHMEIHMLHKIQIALRRTIYIQYILDTPYIYRKTKESTLLCSMISVVW